MFLPLIWCDVFTAMSNEKRVNGSLDGGCSWFIVLGSFLSQFVVMGVNNVFGLLYIDLLAEFGKSKAVTGKSGIENFALHSSSEDSSNENKK